MEITRNDIRLAFSEFEKILEKLNSSYYLINEKYGEDQAKLFEAGFWDKIKSGAGKVGSAIGTASGSVKNVASTAYNKGKELGQQAITAIGEISNKIAGYFSQAYQWVANAPEKFWNNIKDGWNTVTAQIAKMKETAGDKFQLNVGLILEDLNKKLCRKLRELMGDQQMGDYNIARKRPADFKGKYEKFKGTLKAVAQELIKSKYEDAKEFGHKLLETLENVGVGVGIFLLGIIIAPFYLVGWAGKKLFDLGIDFGMVVDKFVKTAKQELPQVWGEFKTGVKTGYQDTQHKPAPVQPNEKKLLNFSDFINERTVKEPEKVVVENVTETIDENAIIDIKSIKEQVISDLIELYEYTDVFLEKPEVKKAIDDMVFQKMYQFQHELNYISDSTPFKNLTEVLENLNQPHEKTRDQKAEELSRMY